MAGARFLEIAVASATHNCGPNFLGAGATETNILAASTITGDFMCRATNVVYRLDTESARSFLGRYVSLP